MRNEMLLQFVCFLLFLGTAILRLPNFRQSRQSRKKISACTGIPCTGIPNNENQNQHDGAVMRYITPSVVRSNSLIDEEELPPENISRSLTMPSPSRSWFPRMGSKKAAAYKEYINEKMHQRNPELAHSEPMKIGVKRTFTDSQGQIREMVAL
mmetsp:Transcript_19404/g.39890  ORF Transcript_19404/g.39890 Transcript_19404/m.39890 type:complete len:153 (+) Transcript_19404:752-1210(+)